MGAPTPSGGSGGGFGMTESQMKMVMQLLGMGLNTVGGVQAMQRFGDLIRSRNTASDTVRDYIRGNTLPDGTAANSYLQTILPYLQMGNDLTSTIMPQYQRNLEALGIDQDTFRNQILPGLMQAQYSSPELEAMRGHFDANVSRINSGLDPALAALHSNGWNENSQRVFNDAASLGDNPYVRNQLDIGGYLLSSGGMNPYTQNALDQSGWGIRSGGYDDNINRIIQESFGNLGIMRDNNASAQNLINSGGYDRNLQTQFNTGLQGLQQFSNADPMSILGPTGSRAIEGLFNSNINNRGFEQTLNSINQFSQNDPTFAAQQGAGFNQGLSMAGQNVNALAPWMQGFLQSAPGFGNNQINLPQLSDFAQYLNIADTGGGSVGGGGVGAAGMNRDLGPVDPKVQEAFERSLAEFAKNPIMSDEQAMGLSRDAAATAAKQQSEAAQRKAINMGGPGILVGSGQTGSAMREFADQAMQAEAAAVREALFNQQGMRLQRSGMEADLAKAMGQLKGNRESIYGQMNIADAGNQTQAAIASANNATAAQQAAANRSMQAQMANSSNAIAIARLLSEQGLGQANLQSNVFQSLLDSATQQRNQNTNQSIAGLNSLPNFLNASNDRFQTQTAGINSALGNLSAFGQNENDRFGTILQSLLGASGQATDRAALFAPLMASATGTAANRLQSGVDLAGSSMQGINGALDNANTAVGSANNRLGIYSQMFNDAETSNNNRMSLGAGMTNQGLQNILQGLGLAGETNQGMLTHASNMGNLVGQLTGNYNTAMNNFGNLGLGYFDANTRQQQGSADMFQNYLTGRQNTVNGMQSAFPLMQAPFQNVSDQLMRYMTGAQSLFGPYAGMFGLSGGTNNNLGNLGTGAP